VAMIVTLSLLLAKGLALDEQPGCHDIKRKF
jgi:hypothetical protein